MNKQGFRTMLQRPGYKLTEEQMKASMAIAERFDAYLSGKAPTAENAWNFSKTLIREGSNTRENYLALVRYCLFIKNHAMYVAMLELVDGGEVGDNLYRRVAERFGQEVRDEIFAGIGVAPYGTPTPEKPAYMQPVIERLEVKVGEQACKDFLSTCLRSLSDEGYLPEREKYRQAGNIDAYLVQRKEALVAELEACLREGRPFYAQEITEEVIAYFRNDPEMEGGVRVGNIVYESKIPYQTKQYLAETDPVLMGYYYCHCPWAREAIRRGNVKLSAAFCNCSAGAHKKTFDVIFGQPLKVEVVESILKGDNRCRFAIYLPKEAVVNKKESKE